MRSTDIEPNPAKRPAHALTVVVPCCNEVEALPSLFRRLDLLATALGPQMPVEYVFVDDGSTDATADVILAYRGRTRGDVRLIRHPHNLGITHAILSGARAARSPLVATIDADASYDPMLLLEMLPLLEPTVAVVTASPYHPAGGVTGVPRWRLALSRLASRLYATLLRNRLHCYTSCFRVYRRAVLQPILPRYGDFAGIAEILWRIDRTGARITEHPAQLGIRHHGQSKMRVLRTALRHAGLLALILRERLTTPHRQACSEPG